MQTDMTTMQTIRARYRKRTEPALPPYQLAALLMQRAMLTETDPAHTVSRVAIDAATLAKIGKALASLAVAECNREWTNRDQTRRDNLTAEAAAIAAEYGLTITASGDPRGYVLRLHGPDIYRNGWGDGFGVA